MQEPVKALTQSYIAHQGDATTSRSARRWSCTPTRRTTRSSPMPTATSPTSTATSFRGATPRFDWTKPVDGSNPATEWHGLLSVDETPHLLNPTSGWLYNTQQLAVVGRRPEQPEARGLSRVRRERAARSARGLHAIRVLAEQEGFHARVADRRGLRQLSPWFEKPMPALIKAWDAAPASDPLKAKLAEQIALLRGWDLRWARRLGADVARRVLGRGDLRRASARTRAARACPPTTTSPTRAAAAAAAGARRGVRQAHRRLRHLEDAVGRDQSLPAPHRRHRPAVQRRRAEHPGRLHVVATGARWRRSARAPIPARRSGTARAATASSPSSSSATACARRAVTAGGESGDPKSPHFNDQAQRYAPAICARSTSTRTQLKGHTERSTTRGSDRDPIEKRKRKPLKELKRPELP